jgi:predicted transcriptional regulator
LAPARNEAASRSAARDEGTVALNVRVKPDLRRRARRAAVELRAPMRKMVEEALDAYLKRRGY